MPFHLFLLRHAETELLQSGQSDFDRELLPKGIEQIQYLSQHLSKIGLYPDSIISSPARRAKTTAIDLMTALKVSTDKIHFHKSVYTAEASGLLNLIQETDNNFQHLLLVGHNPALSDLGTYLVKGFADGLRTCDLVWIELNIEQWTGVHKGTGQLKKIIHATPLKNDK